MTTTPDIGLPLLEAQQQQPNVTHNQIVYQLSALMNGVINMTTNSPPGSPTEGDSYVIGSTPTGAWAGKAYCIATYTSGGWMFIPDRNSAGTPLTMGARQEGLRTYNRFDNTQYAWDGAAWIAI